jgi:hypothetical protein
MNADALIRDPVFQLNLLLWMAKEQPPEGYVVKPLFFANGFEVVYIEQPFPLPPGVVEAVEQSGKDIAVAPEPELLLGRLQDNKALYFEAKADSFSPASSTSKQARGHLLAAGDAFAEVMQPLQFCLLCYVVPEDRRDLMTACLLGLVADLAGASLKCGAYSTHGLSVEDFALRYSWDQPFQQHVGVDGSSAIVLEGLAEDTDPSPLFLVYTDEDYPDNERRDILRRCLINQVHALLVCDLNALPIDKLYERSAESLLLDMTDDLYRFLGRKRKKGMRRLITENIFRRIADFAKDKFSGSVFFEGQEMKVRFPDATAKTAFLEWLEDFKRTAFPAKRPSEEQPTLFDGVQDGDSA